MKKKNKIMKIEHVENFVLVFDIPKILAVEKVRVNRELHRAGAKRVQDSFWKASELNKLIEIAMHIRRIGGKAEILEEKFLL